MREQPSVDIQTVNFLSRPVLQSEPDVVPQTDLVPTLALLLGVPIPYSSVGQVLLPLFPSHGQTEGVAGGLSQLEALWINAKQVVAVRHADKPVELLVF